ncbi:hypothetical protein X735_06255 [Mesorhizobium sp. L2C085B000]|nr:hypothetical protein X735_06255 [Mesorhizobium sp. L2C085B000]
MQHDRVWADGQHVLADLPQMRHGPEAAHDAADAERVGNGLAQAVFLRHLEIGDGAGLVTADLEGDDDEVGTGERLALVGIGLGLRLHAQRRDQLVDDDGALFQPLRIDVHQRDRRA